MHKPLVTRSPPLDEVVGSLYRFRNHPLVTDFLGENPFLLPVLLEVHPQVQAYFGPDTVVYLEVFTDPEAEHDRRLFALVHADRPIEEALDRLDAFDQWWVTMLPRAGGKMSIDLE